MLFHQKDKKFLREKRNKCIEKNRTMNRNLLRFCIEALSDIFQEHKIIKLMAIFVESLRKLQDIVYSSITFPIFGYLSLIEVCFRNKFYYH